MHTSARRRPQQKHSAHATSTVALNPQAHEFTVERLRPGYGARPARDHDPITDMLASLCQVLDNAKTCDELSTTLDQLLAMSSHYKKDWEPLFQMIMYLLSGSQLAQNKTETIKTHIAILSFLLKSPGTELDTLTSTIQKREVADFGQDILEYFIKEINDLATDSSSYNTSPSIETLSLLIRCFDIIIKSLVMYDSRTLDRLGRIQDDSLNMLYKVKGLSTGLEMAAWKIDLSPQVVMEITQPKGALMQLRWVLPSNSTRYQDVLDIILLFVPSSSPSPKKDSMSRNNEPPDLTLMTWSSVMHEIDDILESLCQKNTFSTMRELDLVINKIDTSFRNEIDNSSCHNSAHHEARRGNHHRTGATATTLISSLTFDILLLVELVKLWPKEANLIFLRLLKNMDVVPQSRFTITVYALKDISASCEFFIPDWLNRSEFGGLETKAFDSSPLGVLLSVIQLFLTRWKLVSSSIKICVITWYSSLLTTLQPYRKTSTGSQAWAIIRKTLSSTLHQLTTIAGVDDDDMIRGSIAIIFEGFISAFGSFNLGPEFLATMADRSLDISPIVRVAWRKVIFQTNPFAFAFECYNRTETDISRALKILVLKSPNSGIFRYPHFSTVLSALEAPGEIHAQTDGNSKSSVIAVQDGDMLQRLFHSCQGKEIIAKVNADSGTVAYQDSTPDLDMIAGENIDTFQHSLDLLTYWSLWETARYCVLSRLRTPFGGPQQTLDTLEKQLNSHLRSDNNDTTDNFRLMRLRDFLTFLDRLELQVYNAHHGTALGVIPLTPKPSIVFVRSNKKMWDEWFTRIRGRIIEGAKVTGEHELIIRNGYILIADYFSTLSRGSVSDIISWMDEFERVLVDLVEALIATRGSDAIAGLYVWCRRAIKDMTKQQSSSKSKSSRSERSAQYPRYRNSCLNEGQAIALSQISLDWINTAVMHAQNRYEQSVKEAMPLMESLTAGDNNNEDVSAPTGFLCQEIANNLSDLQNYQQLQTFMDSISEKSYTHQTLMWSNNAMARSLEEFCANEASHAWKSMEEFYETGGKNLLVPEALTFDRSGIIGRNFLFAAKIYEHSNQQTAELDHFRQQAFDIVQPCAEFSLYKGLDHASSILIDATMLNTAASATPQALDEFMGQLALIPDELRMNMFHRNLRYWGRLDALVNLARKNSSSGDTAILKQSNEFKYLLSKIARRSECHNFASNIPRTWVGTLSPEIQLEQAKAAIAKNDYSTALDTSRRILENVQSLSASSDDQSNYTFQSKIYLKMAKWSRSTKPQLSEDNIRSFEDILELDHQTQQPSTQARIESITATCLQKAIDIESNHRKAWFSFGTHHYKQGWGILDELGSFRFHHPVATAANDKLRGILEDAGVDRAEEQVKDIFCVFVRHCASGQPFDESVAYESIRAHVIKIDEIAESESILSAIIESFQTLLQRILESYRLAIHGYFRFLQFTALEFECNKPTTSKAETDENTEVEVSQSAVSDEITATLRLLRLLAKHGGQLYETFHDNLVDINVSPWISIIPQLFARLDHPEKPVQSLITDLLCKIAAQYPQLIVFHCVVGANSAHNTTCQRRLLGIISDFLNKSHPALLSQVQHLIRGLERITVLWEEVWHKKIMVSLPELKNTLQELTEQYQRLDDIAGLGIEEKNTVMSDNYRQAVTPLLATFESLQESNSHPESNHERWFVTKFRDRIQAALESLRSPKAWSNLFEGLTMFKEIYMELGKELSGTRILQLSDLSPELASIQSSLIDIPNPNQGTGITIQSFEKQVVVIPTKTKPKKLSLQGSDGKRYTYLFKGMEDLHLDERVMQLLRISNGMLQRDKDSSSRQLNARHYAVVPLSDNSGMIQWVENTVSIFTIIAKWQHRELMCTRWMNDDTSTGPHQAPQRATEVYHEKAAAALKRAGLPSNHPRRQWPKSVLLDLYHEMASETPADLLEREIWSSSPTPAEWWRKSTRFARSTAVMSMIGYVIGLGDRHLDNILIDFTTGDLVHIDYNVCFEKGKRLRIPEIVPFRLSRNMLTSLGVTGVEGNFRIGCEQTMKVMRKNKEILVTLLEAFIYDPLVDWQIEATAVQGGVGAGTGLGVAATGGAGFDVGQANARDGHSGLIAETEMDTSSSSVAIQRDSRFSIETSNSGQSVNSRRRLSNDSLASISSTSIKSTATVDFTTRKWNPLVGDQVDSGMSGASVNITTLQQQQQPQQQDHQQSVQPASNQRNAYAVHILRRVRHKLEGRDFETVKKCKVTEQVDRVIQEATNVENLANMYEGWTPWL
ncbi:Serine/threonine-protein kinase smg1 [Haplosporangium sp. Z 27]|nr:Serine/threonine-protein kinase smg1 [Haplosporangium sp. Z 27]